MIKTDVKTFSQTKMLNFMRIMAIISDQIERERDKIGPPVMKYIEY